MSTPPRTRAPPLRTRAPPPPPARTQDSPLLQKNKSRVGAKFSGRDLLDPHAVLTRLDPHAVLTKLDQHVLTLISLVDDQFKTCVALSYLRVQMFRRAAISSNNI